MPAAAAAVAVAVAASRSKLTEVSIATARSVCVGDDGKKSARAAFRKLHSVIQCIRVGNSRWCPCMYVCVLWDVGLFMTQ